MNRTNILTITIEFSALTVILFCGYAKDKKNTINDYRDDYCGNFKCKEFRYNPAPTVINTYNITISKSPIDSYLIFSNIPQALKLNVSNLLVDGNEIKFQEAIPANSQIRLIYGSY